MCKSKRIGYFCLLCLFCGAFWSFDAWAYKVVWSGKVTGVDGRQLRFAHVAIQQGLRFLTLAEVAAKPDGTFRIEAKVKGLLRLRFQGLHHRAHFASFYIKQDQHFQVSVSLGTKKFHHHHEKLRVRTELNRFARPGLPLKPHKDGTYRVRIKTKKASIRYMLSGAIRWKHRFIGTTAGTSAERYEYDKRRGYLSITKANKGEAEIIFDPTKRPPLGRSFVFRHLTPAPWQQKFQALYHTYKKGMRLVRSDSWKQSMASLFQKQKKDSTSRPSTRPQPEKQSTSVATSRPKQHNTKRHRPPPSHGFSQETLGQYISKQLRQETDPVFRKIYLFWNLRLMSFRFPALEQRWVKELCTLAEQDESLWSDPTAGWLLGPFARTSFVNPQSCSPDLYKVTQNKSDILLRAHLLAGTAQHIHYLMRYSRKKKTIQTFLKRYPSVHPWMQQLKQLHKQSAQKDPKSPTSRYINHIIRNTNKRMGVGNKIKKGSPIPDISVPLLSNPKQNVHLQKALQGKIGLIHFWASWCVCVSHRTALGSETPPPIPLQRPQSDKHCAGNLP